MTRCRLYAMSQDPREHVPWRALFGMVGFARRSGKTDQWRGSRCRSIAAHSSPRRRPSPLPPSLPRRAHSRKRRRRLVSRRRSARCARGFSDPRERPHVPQRRVHHSEPARGDRGGSGVPAIQVDATNFRRRIARQNGGGVHAVRQTHQRLTGRDRVRVRHERGREHRRQQHPALSGRQRRHRRSAL